MSATCEMIEALEACERCGPEGSCGDGTPARYRLNGTAYCNHTKEAKAALRTLTKFFGGK